MIEKKSSETTAQKRQKKKIKFYPKKKNQNRAIELEA